MSNDYSEQWFDTFLSSMPPEQTAREIAFLARNLFQPAYATVLDLCCGMGRHARALSQLGYHVTGVDTNPYALEEARRADARTRYVLGDMRTPDALGETFDAVLILWQSFGNFDEATNESNVRRIAAVLNPRGRFVLDIYNRYFYDARQGELTLERAGRTIHEKKWLDGNRLHVTLDYGNVRDAFEWQIFYPDEIAALAARFGLREVLRCTNFDEAQLPKPEVPRMQFIFEKST